MASDTDCPTEAVVQQKEEGIPPVKQLLEEVDGRLVTLSEKITMCDRVLEDLKDLEEIFPGCVLTTAEVTRSGTDIFSF
ncbi:hypothetical protein FQN60_017127 [Scomber scombrus]|uniref:Uncharacterized protein n=1 Tax=Scomber scombrus TaxID=13677 RepID=A0AAV1P281_SCOSC